jgi:DnaJ-class molecular chaperone
MRKVPIRRQKKEVVLAQCPSCKGKGSIKVEDSDETLICFRCGGSGEIVIKRTLSKPIIRMRPNKK